MTVPALIVLAFLAIWGVASTITQVRAPWAQRLRRLDPIGITGLGLFRSQADHVRPRNTVPTLVGRDRRRAVVPNLGCRVETDNRYPVEPDGREKKTMLRPMYTS